MVPPDTYAGRAAEAAARAKANANLPRCCKLVRQPGTWGRQTQCKRAGIVTVGKEHYCKQHDPAEVEKRRNASQAKATEEYKAFKLRAYAGPLKTALADLLNAQDMMQHQSDYLPGIKRRNLDECKENARRLLKELE